MPHTGPAQGKGVDALQIQMIFFAPLFDEGFRFRAVGLQHGGGHIAIGLKVALGNIGPDGSADILRLTAEIFNHGCHGLPADVLSRAPPARVGRAHSPGDRVVQQKRRTVGGEHQQGHAGGVRHQRVTLGVVPVTEPGAVLICHHANDIGVNL